MKVHNVQNLVKVSVIKRRIVQVEVSFIDPENWEILESRKVRELGNEEIIETEFSFLFQLQPFLLFNS